MDPAVLAPIIVALITPIGAYLLTVRRMSGKIATSDAAALWTESRSIREDYRTRIQELEARIDKLEALNDALANENLALKIRINELEKEQRNGRNGR